MRVSLKWFGNPQRLLLNVHVQSGEVPLDIDLWHSLDLAGK